jgi:hypothetical protein
MYSLINKNIETLLDGISNNEHVQPYVYISRAFKKDENRTREFKSTYRKFYQLNAARLSEEFCEKYFSLLDECKSKSITSVEYVINNLYEVPGNAKEVHAIHFSFATKLVHTVNPNLPIYDSMVSTFYFAPEVKYSWKKEQKIQACLRTYEFLQDEYKRITDENLLSESIEKFRMRFNIGSEYSDCKVIDTLLWRCTVWLKSGAVCNHQIQYS